jgi:hypothetical protein
MNCEALTGAISGLAMSRLLFTSSPPLPLFLLSHSEANRSARSKVAPSFPPLRHRLTRVQVAVAVAVEA